jgi:AraC family transcriptional regulator, positive regulator of tynA and feaB
LFGGRRRKNGFADPDFDPRKVAAKVGISLQKQTTSRRPSALVKTALRLKSKMGNQCLALQKLFTQRGLTSSEFIYSLRLDHAAHLLHRRALLGTSQSLSEIAYASGFSDYTHFARKFRLRFGHPPGAHSAGDAASTVE